MSSLHEVETIFKEGFEFDSIIDGHHLTIDASIEGGGKDKGPRPKALLLSSLAACTGMDIVSLLEKMRVNYSDFALNVKADLSDEHPKVYTQIYLEYKIKVKPEDKEKVEKAVDLSKHKYCGVSAMLSKVCPIDFKITYID
ncbi:MAG: OsmC family protein [Bacteroidia bacterium]